MIKMDFNKKLYWIDTQTVQSLNEWLVQKENELRQQIVKTNQELWEYDYSRRIRKTNKQELYPNIK